MPPAPIDKASQDLESNYQKTGCANLLLSAPRTLQLEKPRDYYSHPRPELVPLVPSSVSRILEVGCGEGAFAAALRAAHLPQKLEIVGVENYQPAAALAACKLDTVYVGDIETLELPYESYFDCVVFADVLEHLVDPWATLVKIRKHVAVHGCVVASIPNVQHWRVISNLVRGSWDYTSEGILDRTHLRFFTRKSILRLFADTGYRVLSLHPFVANWKGKTFNRALGGLLTSFLAFQYFVVADRMN